VKWLALLLAIVGVRAELLYIGSGSEPEWDEFANLTKAKTNELHFEAKKNEAAATLYLRQRDVKVNWPVKLNGHGFTNLFLSEDDLVNAWPLPAGALKDGTNTLTFVVPKEADDIFVGDVRVETKPADATISVAVTEDEKRIPSRVTLVDGNGSLFPASNEATNAAARPGVFYLGEGAAKLKLPAGDYTLYAGRGFEYSISTQKISLKSGETKDVPMQIKREVNTRGWVASDTHVHTWTLSRHGDATLEERMITLAGEGIELPIATDHNLLADYTEPARKTGMDRYFTPVIGDEVTTPQGHFNIFPVAKEARMPNPQNTDWPRLMKEIRGTAGVRVAILNHPRNVHTGFQPFASTNFNARTGQNLRGFEFTFDAIEVCNSSALQSDTIQSFKDWLALLNYGYRITAVGSSDVHDVSRYIVGQGRTYIRADDSDPGKIDINKACDSFLAGRALVSMGLLTDMIVDERFGVGDLATNLPPEIKVSITVQGPTWVAATNLVLYGNGEVIREETFQADYSSVGKKKVTWTIPRFRGDVHLVAIATGPAVREPFWPIPKPYQASSKTWTPRVIGATNPIYLDTDGDGKFTAPRLQRAANKSP
jgi:hypothetical protein